MKLLRPVLLAVFFAGDGLDDVDQDGNYLQDDDMLLLVNSHSDPIDFELPFEGDARPWELLIDTADDGASEHRLGGELTPLPAASLKLMTRRRKS